jgi:hypothetical protein
MKTLYTAHLSTLMVLLLCSVTPGFAGNGTKTEPKETQIFVAGFINASNAVLNQAIVRLYDRNELVDSVAPDEEGGFYFQLPANSHCTIEIEREGYIKKLISINTKMNEERKRLPMFEFTIDLNAKEDYRGVDISDLDFPAAIVDYSTAKRKLEYSMKYASFMQKEQTRLLQEAASTQPTAAR